MTEDRKKKKMDRKNRRKAIGMIHADGQFVLVWHPATGAIGEMGEVVYSGGDIRVVENMTMAALCCLRDERQKRDDAGKSRALPG
jgi:hypothetical protein